MNEFRAQQIASGVGTAIGFLVFIGIWIIMIMFIEWDGSKPGGWGYFLAFIASCTFSILGAMIISAISKGSIHALLTYKK